MTIRLYPDVLYVKSGMHSFVYLKDLQVTIDIFLDYVIKRHLFI